MGELRTNETVREYLESCGLLKNTKMLCVIVATCDTDNTKKDIFGYEGYGDNILCRDGSDILDSIIVDFNGCYNPLAKKHYFEFIV